MVFLLKLLVLVIPWLCHAQILVSCMACAWVPIQDDPYIAKVCINVTGAKLNLLKKCYTTLQELEGMHMHHMQTNIAQQRSLLL